jgi:hypothetical protein
VTEEVELLESEPHAAPVQFAPLSDQVTPSPASWETLTVRVTESPGSTVLLAGAMETTGVLLELPPQPQRQLRKSDPVTAQAKEMGDERNFMNSSEGSSVRSGWGSACTEISSS